MVSREKTELPRLRALLPEVIVDEMLAGGRREAGWQFLTLTERDPEKAHVSLVLCTTAAATIREPAMVEYLDQLGVRVLCQPFLIAELLEVVENTLASARMTR